MPYARFAELLRQEHALSDAYVRLRQIIGAMDPPTVTDAEALWAYVESVAREKLADQPQPKGTADHVPVSPEREAAIDAAVGLVLLPPIRVDPETYAAIEKLSKANGMIVQATVRDMIWGACRATGETPAPAPVAVAEPELTDEQIVAHLEAAGVEFQRFMGGIAGTKDCWSTAGSQDVRKIAAGVRAAMAAVQAPAPAAGRYVAEISDTGAAKYWPLSDEQALALAQAPAVGSWIAVSDRLPEKNAEVLVALSGISIPSTGQYTGSSKDRDPNGWCYPAENNGTCDDGSDPVVTHWMPLPDPPKCDVPVQGSGNG